MQRRTRSHRETGALTTLLEPLSFGLLSESALGHGVHRAMRFGATMSGNAHGSNRDNGKHRVSGGRQWRGLQMGVMVSSRDEEARPQPFFQNL